MPGKALEIGVDHRLRFVRADLEPSGQAPARDAVEDREVDRLGAPARVAVDLAEQLLRGAVVDVLALRKGIAQRIDIGHVRGQPQLDLAVVGGQDDIAGLCHEGMPDLTADFGADRNVLQIGFGR